ncbi:MAG: lipid-A-disaccharide synthase, partial [Desulfobacteraceae bacterium]|nr:lipid-A-disaccharide synthase [Desulfobacteraceae bacterium]
MSASLKHKHIMVLAGEPSGDQHAAGLIKEIKKMDSKITFSGIGGPLMQKQDVDLFFHIDKLSVMGLVEVILQIQHVKDAFSKFRNQLKLRQPDMIILVDYPGFNLKAAQFAKSNYDVKIFYYITPKVWAWNRSRLTKIRKVVDHAAVILPFEEKLYKKYKIPSTYVGHPLIDGYPELGMPQSGLQGSNEEIKKEKLEIGLLPGSRKTEIKMLLRPMLEAAQKIFHQNNKTSFLVSCAPSVDIRRIESIVGNYNSEKLFTIVKGTPQKIFHKADLLIAASGTVTLEAALCCVPTIIVYKMSAITAFAARAVIRVKYVGLANLIAGRELMPELLQENATPEKISRTAFSMIKNLALHQDRLRAVRKILGPGGAAKKAGK